MNAMQLIHTIMHLSFRIFGNMLTYQYSNILFYEKINDSKSDGFHTIPKSNDFEYPLYGAASNNQVNSQWWA